MTDFSKVCVENLAMKTPSQKLCAEPRGSSHSPGSLCVTHQFLNHLKYTLEIGYNGSCWGGKLYGKGTLLFYSLGI